VQDLITVDGEPESGAILWCEEMIAGYEKLQSMIQSKGELTLFQWELEHSRPLT